MSWKPELDEIAARRIEFGPVGRFVARICVEIFARCELCGVHEDAGDRFCHLGADLLHKRQMPPMQGPHCGNKSNSFTGLAPCPNLLLQLGPRAYRVR